MQQHEEKLTQAISYAVAQVPKDTHFSPHHLYYTLFLADQAAETELGRSITGADYHKTTAGPMPQRGPDALFWATERGTISNRTVSFGRGHRVYLEAKDAAPTDELAPEEQEIIGRVGAQVAQMNQKDVVRAGRADPSCAGLGLGDMIASPS